MPQPQRHAHAQHQFQVQAPRHLHPPLVLLQRPAGTTQHTQTNHLPTLVMNPPLVRQVGQHAARSALESNGSLPLAFLGPSRPQTNGFGVNANTNVGPNTSISHQVNPIRRPHPPMLPHITQPATTPTQPIATASSHRSAPQSATTTTPRHSPESRRKSSTTSASQGRVDPESPNDPPPILVREKKQKACSNCRRAKLKCIVNDGKTDCVRCTARKEKCIFFARTHDEDWQQTLTSDVYGTMSHLTHVDSALRHVLQHLTSRGLIPPFQTEDCPAGLPPFDPPERDMTYLQGWGGDKAREKEQQIQNRSKRKGRADEEENEPVSPSTRRLSQRMLLPPPATTALPLPAQQLQVTHLRRRESDPPTYSTGIRHGSMTTPPMSFWNHNIRQAGPGPDYSSPFQQPIPLHPFTPHNGDALILPQATPTMGILDINIAPPQSTSVVPVAIIEKLAPQYDENNQLIFGSTDVRQNVIKKGLISPQGARQLVTFFHRDMAPFMFGYSLKLGHFPYLPEGPATITPFILGVLCLLASERMSGLSHDHQKLADHVVDLLDNSPAESWQNFDSSRQEGRLSDEDDILDPELGIGPEEIVGACILASYMGQSHNAERSTIAAAAFKWARGWIKVLNGAPRNTIAAAMGIVPEERKADAKDMARIWLLCYIVDGTEAVRADQLLVEDLRDPFDYCLTLVPLTLTPNDKIARHDILLTSRAKLISLLRKWYYTRNRLDDNEILTPESLPEPVPIVPNQTGGLSITSNPNNPNHPTNPHEASSISRLKREIFNHKRLASTTNAELEWWRENLAAHRLSPRETRQIEICYLFARVLVNSNIVVALDGRGGNGVRQASLVLAVDAALESLGRAAEWSGRELASLPTFDLYILTSVAGFLHDIIKGQNGYGSNPGDKNTAPIITADDAIPLFSNLADRLNANAGLGGLAFTETANAINKLLRELTGTR